MLVILFSRSFCKLFCKILFLFFIHFFLPASSSFCSSEEPSIVLQEEEFSDEIEAEEFAVGELKDRISELIFSIVENQEHLQKSFDLLVNRFLRKAHVRLWKANSFSFLIDLYCTVGSVALMRTIAEISLERFVQEKTAAGSEQQVADSSVQFSGKVLPLFKKRSVSLINFLERAELLNSVGDWTTKDYSDFGSRAELLFDLVVLMGQVLRNTICEFSTKDQRLLSATFLGWYEKNFFCLKERFLLAKLIFHTVRKVVSEKVEKKFNYLFAVPPLSTGTNKKFSGLQDSSEASRVADNSVHSVMLLNKMFSTLKL
jgi:hypothetical protein